MQTFKLLYFTGLLLNASLCFAHKGRLAVDSVDAVTRERVKVIEVKIGDVDYHKFGNLVIEQKGGRYYITFPFFQYVKAMYGDDSLPKGMNITLKCGARKMFTVQTPQAVAVLWYYTWAYRPYNNSPIYGGNEEIEQSPSVVVYRSGKGFDSAALGKSLANYIYGLNWQVTVELIHDDMLLLSRRKITDAYMIRNDVKVYLPIKGKQAARIQRSVAALLRK